MGERQDLLPTLALFILDRRDPRRIGLADAELCLWTLPSCVAAHVAACSGYATMPKTTSSSSGRSSRSPARRPTSARSTRRVCATSSGGPTAVAVSPGVPSSSCFKTTGIGSTAPSSSTASSSVRASWRSWGGARETPKRFAGASLRTEYRSCRRRTRTSSVNRPKRPTTFSWGRRTATSFLILLDWILEDAARATESRLCCIMRRRSGSHRMSSSAGTTPPTTASSFSRRRCRAGARITPSELTRVREWGADYVVFQNTSAPVSVVLKNAADASSTRRRLLV